MNIDTNSAITSLAVAANAFIAVMCYETLNDAQDKQQNNQENYNRSQQSFHQQLGKTKYAFDKNEETKSRCVSTYETKTFDSVFSENTVYEEDTDYFDQVDMNKETLLLCGQTALSGAVTYMGTQKALSVAEDNGLILNETLKTAIPLLASTLTMGYTLYQGSEKKSHEINKLGEKQQIITDSNTRSTGKLKEKEASLNSATKELEFLEEARDECLSFLSLCEDNPESQNVKENMDILDDLLEYKCV